MYDESKKFTSDLMNSYAWETAILFVQTFDNRNNKTKLYSMQNSLNQNLAETGTNLLEDTTKQDKICNIWDMASNALEWTTETCSFSDFNCAYRGGSCQNNTYCTSTRGGYTNTYSAEEYTFRPILYLK